MHLKMTSSSSSITSTVRCSNSSNMNVAEEQQEMRSNELAASIANTHRQPSTQAIYPDQHIEDIDVEALSIREATKVETKSNNSIITTDDDNDTKPKTAANNNSTVDRIFAHPLFPILLLVAAGSAVSFQSGMNAAMRATAGRAFSSVTNFTTGSLACLLLFALDLLILRTRPPRSSTIKDAPWYAWMGGVLGTYYILVNIFLVPVHGAGTVLSIFVCSQVISACIMDHFGLTGIKKRRYSIWRMLASLGLIGCVAVITLF
ncbi:hypothetical protein BDB00DRAFT_308137 [Zychaea mexicana]|uniref:uncharacterized protein n=1 Tax=Zychaea mexicana TaxID=64656 RepID=UPI0022FE0BF0|nr:uncharacterized protein BDB00DRAFT_308137 [Zychaea mexicana]KAI9494546.1 hypothetical protein BDB00DRAFT_308137 [Zychaea mexicana]